MLPLVLVVAATQIAPVGTATTDLITYITSFGILGIVALAFAFRRIVPAGMLTEAREQARADIKTELDRVIAEKSASETRLIAERHEVEEQRNEALRLAQREIVPLLVSFTAATTSLIPLLQELVRNQERRRNGGPSS